MPSENLLLPRAVLPGPSWCFSLADLKLVEFVDRSRAKGVPDDQIRSRLYSVGWSQAQIDDAFESSKSSPAAPILPKPAAAAQKPAQQPQKPAQPALAAQPVSASPVSAQPQQMPVSSSGQTAAWQPISQYLPKFSIENSDNFVLNKIYPLISPQYRLNSDIGHNLELGRYFSAEYFKGDLFLQRPLYPFLIFLTSLLTKFFIPTSYGVIFGLAILINFVLISAAVAVFFLLLKKFFSLKVAWLSSILLIFSPYVHSYINQPLAEMLMAFAVIMSCYLLQNYIKKPSLSKLALFSLIIGIFMLGKMFFAISIFILLLAYLKLF